MPFRNTFKLSESGGFSMIELLISTTLVLIIFGGVAGFMVVVNRQFVDERPRLLAIGNVQAATDTIVRLIRSSGSRPASCPGGFAVPPLAPSAPAAGRGSWYS